MERTGCTTCHVPDLTIARDRRVADVETMFDPERGHFNRLFATARPLFAAFQDVPTLPTVKLPLQGSFVVRNIYTDFKRHDLGLAFHEREYDGTIRRAFLTTALWGVGSTSPYGHDGRSIDLIEVILRHGGEAKPRAMRLPRCRATNRSRSLRFSTRSSCFRQTIRRRTWTRVIRQDLGSRSLVMAAFD
jgi:hypothetical protein